MKKQFILLLLTLFAVGSLLLSGCEEKQSPETPKEDKDKDQQALRIPIEKANYDHYDEVLAYVLANEKKAGESNRVDKPTKTKDQLWPENGEVIATIEGKEYRYDLVYLYRLTSAFWYEDYNRESLYGMGSNVVYASGSDFWVAGEDALKTMKEAAVYAELLYLESKEKYDEIKDEIKQSLPWNKHEGEEPYSQTLAAFKENKEDPHGQDFEHRMDITTKEVVAHENAKFYDGQSDENYWRQVESYDEKEIYIIEMAHYFSFQGDPAYTDESTRKQTLKAFDYLKEKYNVKIIE